MTAACAWLVRAITATQAPDPAVRLGATSITARAGLDIYRHAYRARLHECLADDFPALAALLGATAFTVLADRVIAGYPPTEPTLNRYGRRLVQTLRGDAGPARDLSRLEWALVEALHAPMVRGLDAAAVAAIPPAAIATARLRPAPSLRVVASPWDVDACYRAHLRGDPVTAPARTGTGILVLRGADGLRHVAVGRLGAALVSALARGRRLGEVLAATRLPPAEVQTVLAAATAAGCFTAITSQEPS